MCIHLKKGILISSACVWISEEEKRIVIKSACFEYQKKWIVIKIAFVWISEKI